MLTSSGSPTILLDTYFVHSVVISNSVGYSKYARSPYYIMYQFSGWNPPFLSDYSNAQAQRVEQWWTEMSYLHLLNGQWLLAYLVHLFSLGPNQRLALGLKGHDSISWYMVDSLQLCLHSIRFDVQRFTMCFQYESLNNVYQKAWLC